MQRRMERRPAVRYEVATVHPSWFVDEGVIVPESALHDHAVELLRLLLQAFAARTGRGHVFRNMAVRWVEADARIGLDPEVSFFDPAPPDPESITSIRVWMPGHEPPRLAIEVVSETNAEKDYATAPDRYVACGVPELWVFDPLLAGPSAYGGPFRIQVWVREGGELRRIYAGEGPARSPLLDAFLVTTDDGKRLRIADDPEGASLWPTPEEVERRGRENALARVAELEALLAERNR